MVSLSETHEALAVLRRRRKAFAGRAADGSEAAALVVEAIDAVIADYEAGREPPGRAPRARGDVC
ncbi:MAG TPA: hypothetical protein VFR63_09205 [Gaiellaceae bacterium]|jgi:hypothetical protein|nr:hypothetical protein [Gaiellaceae bacterium]